MNELTLAYEGNVRTVYDSVIAPIAQNIGELHQDYPGAIDCILWTKSAEDGIEEYGEKLPNGVTIFHCSNTSVNLTHHWLEFDIPQSVNQHEAMTYIWDGSRQKLKDSEFVNKADPKLWDGYSSPAVTRQPIYPEFEE